MPKLKEKLPLFALFVILLPGVCFARHLINQDCGSTFCGNLNISFPFRIKGQPPQCGYINLELECENNNRTTLVGRGGKFSVQQIIYEDYTMQVIDASMDTDDCNSLPLSSVYDYYYDYIDNYYKYKPLHFFVNDYYGRWLESSIIYVVNCTKPIKSSLYIEASRCTTKSNPPSSLPTFHFYFLNGNIHPSDINQACTVEAEVPIMVRNITGMFTLDIYKKLLEVEVILFRLFSGIFCLLALVMYKWRRRHLSMDDIIEDFLQSQNNLVPIRYSFKEIRKMTRSFKEKLGEGGYGSVFKEKLRSGHHVAVKLLDKSKGNGQDFINEVASIRRIHRANVTKLIGFCVERSKQALVYDFMLNGSLDKIIFSEENTNTLGWKKIFDIVLGMQILHFDIKPHNILLDENFIPKVSDFGLAKLYSVDDSFVSLTAARGTIGYIAPELIYKNLGGISYKADVYSFGMLLMDMVGRRKNVNAFADHTKDIEFSDVSDDEKVMVRKMIITAFWCIQLLPTNRPSMGEVLKLLETDVELFEMPPKPFYQLPLQTSMEVHSGKNLNDETSSSLETVTNDQF
ncbi:hypothetical protein V6Z11_D01G039400 [Gossypium hirsutum]